MDDNYEDNLEGTEDEVFGSLNSFSSLLEDHDDRGLVLSLAAFAEEALGKLLEAFLLPVKSSTELLNGFNAPLGTFSARIKTAHSLGILTEKQFNDLEQLRKIRNLFAHTWQQISLEDHKVAAHIRSMSYSPFLLKHPETPKKKLQTSGFSLLMALTGFAGNLVEQGGGAKPIAGEIVLGFPGDFNEQIKWARDDFQSICTSMQTAKGEALSFYRQALITLHGRTEYLNGADSEADEQAIDKLRNEIMDMAISINI